MSYEASLRSQLESLKKLRMNELFGDNDKRYLEDLELSIDRITQQLGFSQNAPEKRYI